MRARRSSHDLGRVVRDLAVMLADGGDCLADLGAVRDDADRKPPRRRGAAGTCKRGADQIEVAERALEQIPSEQIEGIEILLRVDCAGATHELLDWAREHGAIGRVRAGFVRRRTAGNHPDR